MNKLDPKRQKVHKIIKAEIKKKPPETEVGLTRNVISIRENPLLILYDNWFDTITLTKKKTKQKQKTKNGKKLTRICNYFPSGKNYEF